MQVNKGAWAGLLAAQSGVCTRAQALAVGWNDRAIEHRCGADWQRLLPGVYLTSTGVPTRTQRVWAGLLYAGDGAALTSWTGLEEWGLPHDDWVDLRGTAPGRRRVDVRNEVHVAVPHTRRRADRPFLVKPGRVVLHRTIRSLKERRTIPTLPVERCVIDACLGLANLTTVRAVVSTVVQRGRTTVPLLWAELEKAPQQGSGLLRTALGEVGEGARSAPEAVLVAALRSAALPPYRLNADIHDNAGQWLARGDLVIEELKLLVEVDGQRWHLSPERWRADLERHTRLEAQGWTVLRYPADRVLTDVAGVVAEIVAVATRLAKRLTAG